MQDEQAFKLFFYAFGRSVCCGIVVRLHLLAEIVEADRERADRPCVIPMCGRSHYQ